MATPDATVKGPNANSYVTLEEANELVSLMLPTEDVKAWEGECNTGADNDERKDRILIAAASRLDREKFLGEKATSTQAMEWPRIRIRTLRLFKPTIVPIPNDPFNENKIPKEIKIAQTILAVWFYSNTNSEELNGLECFDQVSIGSLNITPSKYGNLYLQQLPPLYARYLRGLRIGSDSQLRINRS